MSINQWDFTLKEFPNSVAYVHMYPVVEIKNTTCVLAPIDQNTFVTCMTTFQDLSFAGVKADMVKMCNTKCVNVINLWHNCMTTANYSNPDLLSQYYRSACTAHPSQGYNCLSNRLEQMEQHGNSIQDYLTNNKNGFYPCDSCTRESMRSALAAKDYLSTLQLQDYGADNLNNAQSSIKEQCGKPWEQLSDPVPVSPWQLGTIIAASILGFLLVVFGIYYYIRRKKRNDMLRPPSSSSMKDSTATLMTSKLPQPSEISSSKTKKSGKFNNDSDPEYDPYEAYKVSSFQ
eukprot:NODE_430_length_8744_cov_0.579988.p2 type:complete len:288 gc:universal NODE_430_length_8744_cov_0.579988:4465-3602(-)